MKWGQMAALAAALMLPVVGMATEVPKPGELDARIKHVVYNSRDVVKIVGHYGYSTHILFSPSETVENVALGDSMAWEVAPIGHHLFVKPRTKKATTNMTVLTNKHVYNFILTADKATKPSSDELYFQVAFKYPAAKAKRKHVAAKLEERLHRAKATKQLLANAGHQADNWNYVGCGTEAIMPNFVWDDGVYTYMQFNPGRRMPAVFVVDGIDGHGGESLVNTHVDHNTIVIHRTAPKFVLRLGEAVACVTNRAYDPDADSYKTKTYSPNVIRVLKTGANQ